MTHSTQAFDFNCCRSGNCCRTGHGQVWLKEEEMEGIGPKNPLEGNGVVTRSTDEVSFVQQTRRQDRSNTVP